MSATEDYQMQGSRSVLPDCWTASLHCPPMDGSIRLPGRNKGEQRAERVCSFALWRKPSKRIRRHVHALEAPCVLAQAKQRWGTWLYCSERQAVLWGSGGGRM